MTALVVLVGAGASHGAAAVFPRRPPLGTALFGELCEAFPSTWGSLEPAIAAIFAGTGVDEGFEAGMAAAWEQLEWHPHTELWDLAVFFTRFELNPHQASAYDDLVAILGRRGLLATARFVSLNYETLLEQALERVGIAITYGIEHVGPPAAGTFLKPHGSCNWLPPIRNMRSARFGQSVGDYEGPLEALHPARIRSLPREGFSPAMSLYATGKPSPVAPGVIFWIRDAANGAIEDADAVLIVGACPRLVDEHVFGPLTTTPARVLYVGGDEAIDEFVAARADRPFERIGSRFLPSMREIDAALGSL